MKQYYIVCLKHTSKGDTALTFWGANGSGYTRDKRRAGLYTEEGAKSCISDDNIMVEQEKVDPFWMNAVDFNDKFIAVPNMPTVLQQLGLSDKLMKPKKMASCKMVFLNTPVENKCTGLKPQFQLDSEQLRVIKSMGNYWEEVSTRENNTQMVINELSQMYTVISPVQVLLIVNEYAKRNS